MIEIDLAEITEPILACPNDPDDVKMLSEVADTQIDDVFLGSCMTNIGHFRAAGEIWKGQKFNAGRAHLDLPADADGPAAAEGRGVLRGLQRRSAPASRSPAARSAWATRRACPDGVNVFSTSTRNFDDRIGNGAKVFLGSAELGAVAANLGRLPTPAEYFEAYKEKIEPKQAQVYRYLQFDELAGYQGLRVVA